jgi:hypothetical protein
LSVLLLLGGVDPMRGQIHGEAVNHLLDRKILDFPILVGILCSNTEMKPLEQAT